MSLAPTRRGLLRAAAAGMLLPAMARRAQAGAGRISPPTGAMVFSRILRRELAGGHAVVARRDFEIRFHRLADGYRVEGDQIASSVEAPPNLEAYARLERERREEGMFPLMLDAAGLIRSGPAGGPNAGLDRAIEIALEQVSARLAPGEALAEARSFILGLQQAAKMISSAMPGDLFVPPASARQESRRIALPGGASGQLSTEYWGRTSPDTGLLEEARRIILTETEGTRRETAEHWTLRAAG